MLAFAILIVSDSLLPSNTFYEVAEMGWQESYSRKGVRWYTSYMQTKSFEFAVPNQIHINYPYYDSNKEALMIKASPILNIPQMVSVRVGDAIYEAKIRYTIYSWPIPLHFLLLISAAFSVWKRAFTNVNYTLCFVPALVFCFIILKLM